MYKQHQIDYSYRAYSILKEVGYVYIAGKPRVGKTGIAIRTAEMSKAQSILVLTKKNAIPDWLKAVEFFNATKDYTVTNYEQAKKLKAEDYELVIIDESHNLGGVGKPSKRYQTIRKLCWHMPHIHLSGTAIVESPNSIYYQMSISKYTPFRYKNFYDFFRVFGKPYYITIAGRQINQYDKARAELLKLIDDFTIYITQEDAGIDKNLQAVDKIHYVELREDTKKLYNTLVKDKVAKIGKYGTLILDTTMKERVSLHMLEGGTVKIDDKTIFVGNLEKINYIRDTFGNRSDVGVMCHFKGERELIKMKLPNVQVYSSNAHAEGVDLSHLNHFIIYSSDYSGSKFIQRRERIVNMKGSNTLVVNHLLVKGAISEQVYKAVSKKQDFNNKTYISKNI